MELTPNACELLSMLRAIAGDGPLASSGRGPSSVGRDLIDKLGITQEGSSRSNFRGVGVNAQRHSSRNSRGRVNLFAKVPNWKISKAKSTREFLEQCGYKTATGEMALNCTVTSSATNNQDLSLHVSADGKFLHESFAGTNIVSWEISTLQALIPAECFRVVATVSKRNDIEHFHYTTATYCKMRSRDVIRDLLQEGVITIDHLISSKGGKVVEKGPLFKIRPSNLGALYNETKFDLLEPDHP